MGKIIRKVHILLERFCSRQVIARLPKGSIGNIKTIPKKYPDFIFKTVSFLEWHIRKLI